MGTAVTTTEAPAPETGTVVSATGVVVTEIGNSGHESGR